MRQLATKGDASFWVVLRGSADLTAAAGMHNRSRRGVAVYDGLTSFANQSQAPLRAWLDARNIRYQPYWIVNAIFVKSADEAQLDAIAARPDVKLIRANHSYAIPKETVTHSKASPSTTEWGLNAINAPQVWSTFNDRGEGIVISSIDTGVRGSHAALAGHYRGNTGGSFDNNYNWWDPLDECPSSDPCDMNGHGTHTMGTMVGDDGDPGANQVGVAPHAKWISAKGCCLDTALISSGQWILAPTNSAGDNPRPDLRPDIVNNSWGGGSGDPFFQPAVQAWVASGIFPAFSNGNEGALGCGSAGSPGDLPETYAAGAFDIGGNIASFSSRGPSAFDGIIKPNVSAPGVNVRSSTNGSDTSYGSLSGTSMASPHVAGTVALIWSRSPELRGDVARTEQLLDQSATDVNNTTCGGDASDNNVWGEGKLNALAAVTAAPTGPTGTLSGTVRRADNMAAIGGAEVHVTGPGNRGVGTNPSGQYSMLLPVGTYTVDVTAHGYTSQTASNVDVSQDATTTRDFSLTPVPFLEHDRTS